MSNSAPAQSTTIFAMFQTSSRSLPVAIAEGAILLGGLAILSHLQVPGFTGLPVSPFLFAVAILSAQYGALGGIAAAAVATLLSFSDGMPIRPVEQAYFDFALNVWSPSLTWLGVAVLVGLVADRNFRTLDEARSKLATATIERGLIAGQYEILAARTRRLERQLAGFSEATSRRNKATGQPVIHSDELTSIADNRAVN